MKTYLKRFLSILAFIFCTMTISSAWKVTTSDGHITFEVIGNKKYDLRHIKNIFIPVKVINVSDDLILDILNSPERSITFYEYFRINKINYRLDIEECNFSELGLRHPGISVFLECNSLWNDNNKRDNIRENMYDNVVIN